MLSMKASAADRLIEAKMRAAGVGVLGIRAFLGAVHRVRTGERGLLPERSIEPVSSVPGFEELGDVGPEAGARLRQQLVVIKLNGGLGTGMGLARAKSLIEVKGRDTFLDFIARQVIALRGGGRLREPAFYFMNSFTTQKETLDYLRKYPALWGDEPLDFVQNMVPKISPETFEPVSWPAQPDLEWCPPGHGDIYPVLLGSGLLHRLREHGIKYCFASNSDNLGATVDLKLLHYFAESGLSFLMEVTRRTAVDIKGGHLARRNSTGRLVLREYSQTPEADEAYFRDITRHPYFNTNNLWLRLEDIALELERYGGALPLPVIANRKTVDPRDAGSPSALQLESAIGAAIECFERAGAIEVPRGRFTPVKTTSDLLALRSDAYRITDDHRLTLIDTRRGHPPVVDLDPRYFKMLADFDQAFANGIPSLADCDEIKVSGPVRFSAGVVCQGKVEFINPSPEARLVPPGVYRDVRLRLDKEA
jgi:UDP-N-acetylglucosamine pyrophosphorylase